MDVNRSGTEPVAPGASGSGENDPFGGFGIGDILHLLARRWPVILLCAVGALAFTYYRSRGPVVLTYTAEALLQRQRDYEALGIPGMGMGGGDDIASQVEILQSRAVLEEAVRRLGYRLQLDADSLDIDHVFLRYGVERDAPRGAYVLSRSGAEVVLADANSGEAIASAPAGEPISAAGLDLVPNPDALVDGPVSFRVIAPDVAVARLRRTLVIDPVPTTDLIRIRYTAYDPEFAAAAANAVAEAYQDYSARRSREAATRRREFVASQLDQLADSLKAAQQTLAEYQSRSQMLDPEVQGSALASALMDVEGELRNLRFQESILESLVLTLRNPEGDESGMARIVAMSKDVVPGAEDLFGRIQELQSERSRLTGSRFGYTSAGPAVEAIDNQIAALRTQMREVAEESLELLRSRIASIETQVEDLSRRVGELPARSGEFGRLSQRVDAVQRAFDLLMAEYYEAQIAEAMEGGNVEVVDPALVPRSPNPTGGTPNLIIALLAGALVGVLVAYLLERVDATVRHDGEARKMTRLEVVGSIPRVADAQQAERGGSLVAADPGGLGAESFRALRTTIRFMRAEKPRVLMVTSANPGEGKSMIAANLATALAQDGARVLLIDADLRRPTQHEIFGFSRAPGLSDVLVGEVDLKTAVRVHPVHWLSILNGGTPSTSPAELLGSSAFARFVRQVREQYDSVVIDTPPVLAVADTALLSSQAEGVLVVVRTNRTNRFALARAADQLRKVGAPLLGLVMNVVPVTKRQGRYGGYSSYYYAQDYGYGNGTGSNGRTKKRSLGNRLRLWGAGR